MGIIGGAEIRYVWKSHIDDGDHVIAKGFMGDLTIGPLVAHMRVLWF